MNENITISEAKASMRPLLRKGVVCPCCDRHTQMYARQITSSMGYGLVILNSYDYSFNNSEAMKRLCLNSDWIHVESFFKQIPNIPSSIRSDIPKLRFWGLIEPRMNEKGDCNPNSGYYRITQQGKDFVNGKVKVMSHVLIYNNKMYGFPPEAKEISIEQAIKNKFDYKSFIKE